MSKLPSTKKTDPLKTNINKIPIKPVKKDDIKNFIDSEISKFKIQPAEKTSTNSNKTAPTDDSMKSIKENMKKIKDLNFQAKVSEQTKTEEMFRSSVTKFQGFKMPENKSNFKNPEENFNSSTNEFLRSSSISKNKNPFTMKKFEDVTDNLLQKEIIEDLNRGDNKKKGNFEFELSNNGLSNTITNNASTFILQHNQYDTQYLVQNNDECEEENYYKDFIDEDELLKLEIKKGQEQSKTAKLTTNKKEIDIHQLQTPVKRTKREEILERVKNLSLSLETENFDNMYQFDFNEKNSISNFTIAQNIAKGLLKHEFVQTNECESKSVETIKIETKDSCTFTDEAGNHIQKKQDKKREKNIIANQTDDLDLNKKEHQEYQPLTYETYKFFIKFSPFVEKILTNNINKHILQTNQDLQELKAFSKLDKEYVLSKDLIEYVNLNNLPNYQVHFNTYLFFEINPMLIGMSLTITFYDQNTFKSDYSVFGVDNPNVNLIIIYNLYTNREEKLFFSFSKITHMILLGSSENLILTLNAERNLEIFDLKSVGEKYCQIFENKSNPIIQNCSSKNMLESYLKFKLKLSDYSLGQVCDSNIISVHKKIVETKSQNKNYKIFILNSQGSVLIYEISQNLLDNNFTSNEVSLGNKSPFTNNSQLELGNKLERLLNSETESFNNLKFLEFNLSKKHSNPISEILYILTNLGLAKITLEGKDDILLNSVYKTQSHYDYNIVTSFDVSDTGHLLLAFSDFTIKIIDEVNLITIFQTSVNTLSHDTTLNKIFFANIICKNEKSILIKKSLIANLYVITSKNEFIIFDMNQKNKSEIKKIKKKLELGQKKGLSRRNSLMTLSDSLFTDYSNFIIQSNNTEGKVEFYKLSLRKQFYEINNIRLINDKIIEKISK